MKSGDKKSFGRFHFILFASVGNSVQHSFRAVKCRRFELFCK